MALVTAWRTTRRAYGPTAFSGTGARLDGGRWNAIGTPVVYLSSSRPLSVLEVLTQVRRAADLADYILIPATFDEAEVEALDELPSDWRSLPASDSTRRVGERWIAEARSLVLRVPSVVLPAESNFVLNPAHSAAARVQVGPPEALDIDPRLWG